MLLSDSDISRLILGRDIELRPPLSREQLRPVGIRVHLAADLLVPVAGQLVDLSSPGQLKYDTFDLDRQPFILEPGGFLLGSTIEQVKTSATIVCLLEGRSTIARLGLTIHNTASVLDGTHVGWLTPVLEIANHGNFRVSLCAGMPIGMLCFQYVSGPTSRDIYHSQYGEQRSTTPPNLMAGAPLLFMSKHGEVPKLCPAQLRLFPATGDDAHTTNPVRRKRTATAPKRSAQSLKATAIQASAQVRDDELGHRNGLFDQSELWELSAK